MKKVKITILVNKLTNVNEYEIGQKIIIINKTNVHKYEKGKNY